MLEVKTYTKQEMTVILGTTDNQAIRRKLERYEVKYTSDGWGKKRTFTITHIENKFKLFCITDLGISAATNFESLRDLYYYALNDENFERYPYAEMEDIFKAKGYCLAASTISSYLRILEKNDIIDLHIGDFFYYASYGGYRWEIPQELYSKAWVTYFQCLESGKYDKRAARAVMIEIAGGQPLKRRKLTVNAFYLDKNSQFNELIMESMDKDNIELFPCESSLNITKQS